MTPTTPRPKGRTGRPWRRARARVLRNQDVCRYCGNPVDKTLTFPHPKSPSVDHIVPLSHGGSDLDPNNLALMHLDCNTRKSDKPFEQLDRNSEQW